MHNIYDQFLGSWWGGIIGQSSLLNLVASPQGNLFTQPWLKRRGQIAQMLLESELDNSSSEQSLEEVDPDSHLQHDSCLLSLLPLIIFDRERPNFGSENLHKCNLKSANLVRDSYDNSNVLLWSYLLTTVFNHKTDLLTAKITEEAIFNHSLVEPSPVAKKIRLVETAIKGGITFEELKTRLVGEPDHESTAIALSWYCFISTPYDSKLSIRRAALVEPNLAWLTTALTGTLSGTYNGMARISVNWRIDTQPSSQDKENLLFIRLYKFWLGVYATDANIERWDLAVNAIATARGIQPRPSLKIISQLDLDR